MTSDAGLLPIRQFDERIGTTHQVADPTRGRQQLTFFRGYYDEHRYLPQVLTRAQNGLPVMACLL